MLSYKSRTSGRKGLSRARLFIMKETFFFGAFLGMMCSGKEFLCDAWEVGYLPVAAHCSSCVSGSEGHHCTRGLAELGLPFPPGMVGQEGRAVPGRSCCKEEAEPSWALAELCAAYPKSHHWNPGRTKPLQATRQREKKNGTIMLNYFCYFYSLKAGFWGYE